MAQKADYRLQDPAVLAEIELYGDLVIAASASDGPLTQAQIDQALGVHRPPQPKQARVTPRAG